jgi:hypothetical protein
MGKFSKTYSMDKNSNKTMRIDKGTNHNFSEKENNKSITGHSGAGAIGQFFIFIFAFFAPFLLAAFVSGITESGDAAVIVFFVSFIGVIMWYMKKD